MRFQSAFLIALGIFVTHVLNASAVDTNDTRLLSMPAISSKNIAFVYSEDLWIADLDGKNPRRLTSDLGLESHPIFSPDGSILAFSAQYDGNTDVYTIPVSGGSPKRLTYHPGPDVVRGFTPGGKSILFSSPRHVFSTRHSQLFTVPISGGMPTQLPIPWGFEASYSPDGEFIAYTPVRDATAQWKNYRGGTHSRIWIYNVKTHDVTEILQPKDRCNDLDPNWIGKTIYFRSDREGEYNIFAYDTEAKALQAVTNYTDFPVIDINSDGKKLIFEQAGYLHVWSPGESQPSRIRVGIATDLPETRSRFVSGAKYVRGASLSPSGARVAVEFRGEIVTVPAEKGDPRYLTRTPGVHERSPSWSPDGKTIAYLSDEGGEYHLVLAPQTGKGPNRKVKLEGSGFYSNLVWSRDSKKLLYRDNSMSLYWLDLESGKSKKIVTAKYGLSRGVNPSSWSPDSKWVAYAEETPARISRAYVYSLEQDKAFPVTDGLSEVTEPVFDASGKYLYFLNSSDTGMSKHGFSQSAADSRSPRFGLYMAVLQSGTPSPFLKESDEEKGESSSRPTPPAVPPGKDAGEAPRKDLSELPPELQEKLKAMRAKKKEGGSFKIDFAGLDQRILAIPGVSGNLSNLEAGAANQVFYLSSGSGGEGRGIPGGSLMRYDVDRRRASTVQPIAMAYELSPDGRKVLYARPGGGSGDESSSPGRRGGMGRSLEWYIGSALGGGSSDGGLSSGGGRSGGMPSALAGLAGMGGDKKVNLDAIEVKIDPTQEWKQIFHEAWRINRDFFYDPTMHGADWPAIEKKYEQFLPHLTNGGDLYKVIRWMLSELAVGHSYTTPGERLHDRRTVAGGLLGADFEIANDRYRFKKIYSGLNFTSELRSPLTAPGVNVKEGEYLLAVGGVDLKPPMEIYSLFENTAGKSVELTVGPNPDGKDSRTVSVEPLREELALRNREWIEGNLRKVEKATNGRVGYVYVPDTAGQGVAYFKRYFFPQVDKEALIIDERFNSGGQIADYYIDILRRPFASFWAPRHGAEWRSPSAAVHGPKVMIADEGAGSGGDMLPYMFRKFKLGPIVGKRTWGGLVGISGYPGLMDGGTVTAPSFAIWVPENGWIVENEGVPPDHDIDMLPKQLIAGQDPQLEKAIELALKALEKEPKKDFPRPAYPKRVK